MTYTAMAQLAVGLAVIYAFFFIIETYTRARTRIQLMDFVKRFPGQCPICSYERFGLHHCFVVEFKPDKHTCPEHDNEEYP